MRRGLLIVGALVATLAAGAVSFFSQTTGKESKPHEEPRIVVVKRGPVQTRVAETGTLEPVRTLEIKSPFSGEIQTIHVVEGQRVSANQPLTLIVQEPNQARQVAQIRAALDEERVNLEQTRLALERMRSLEAQGFVSQQDRETAEQNYKRAQVRLELADRQLLLALGGNRVLYERYLARDVSASHLEEFLVTAPSAGTILQVNVHPGAMIMSGTATVGGGTVLMTLADLSRMIIKAKINEVNIGRVRLGQTVEIRLDALPGRVFHGTVTAISPQGEKENSIVTYPVTIEIDNSDQSLKPLMTANVDILTEALPDALHIPLEALRSVNGDDVVYVVANGGRLQRKVRVALRTDSLAVIAHGLQEGDTLVIPSLGDTAR